MLIVKMYQNESIMTKQKLFLNVEGQGRFVLEWQYHEIYQLSNFSWIILSLEITIRKQVWI